MGHQTKIKQIGCTAFAYRCDDSASSKALVVRWTYSNHIPVLMPCVNLAYVSFYQSNCPYFQACVLLSVHLAVHLSICPSACINMYLPVHSPASPSVCLPSLIPSSGCRSFSPFPLPCIMPAYQHADYYSWDRIQREKTLFL